ncbi:FtsW/RodA/SpoVE family cell cycle protein [Mongoliitalea lutea]|uniref:Probable peptidoglycan glycosyltransferase FtsW n=1 Tax=Mongoliitalea lutea TaxID=849756 RepID=A0A8J3CVP9_9BACT|nr:FtsW/RodA/SpoVE family cell cycle protein [Mongoliitalea lutea]GHB33448.1 rod shape-determining protein RodA [Mongoliitalea lutea]
MNALKAWFDRNLKGDPIIWFIVILLSILSILVVYSATGTLAHKRAGGDTEKYLFSHALYVGFALFLMWIASNIKYKYYGGLGKFLLMLSVPLLLVTYFFGSAVNEANRWFQIPWTNIAFQPSDVAKMALIATLASLLAKRQRNIADFKQSLIPMILVVGLICLLIGLANMSTAILLFSTCLLLMFIGRVPLKQIALLLLVGGIALSAAMMLGQRGGTFQSRIASFANKEEIPYQAEHSFIAISTGGLTGKGPGKSEQRNTLPHPYSDFIYSIIVEEYGLIGGVGVLFLYLALLYRGMRIVVSSTKPFGGLLSAGLSFALVLQAMVNMAVAVGLGPITGLPLPLLSMGGTSLFLTGFSIGIILSVSRGDHEDQLDAAPDQNKRRKAFQAA